MLKKLLANTFKLSKETQQQYFDKLSETLLWMYLALGILTVATVIVDMIRDHASIVNIIMLLLFAALNFYILFATKQHRKFEITAKDEAHYRQLKRLSLLAIIVMMVCFLALNLCLGLSFDMLQGKEGHIINRVMTTLISTLFFGLIMYAIFKIRIGKSY
ncbi:hypothetical protein J3T65_01415 [Staphylococcus simiae]|uniref:hypothetical protein n=1 Tax=Staphylococcus simiae TaxID=308354 RepID=UPI001A97BA66|nr:hypothetical protein [Staphylococcus simiae]MBO1198206.1 hypothetical protein [Staphylococcus simiae]MBO1200250.1 hypothetical protein [Staphylococcus simiae]MBO1202586.1 hypothetical protein [Staphylococcus simiae]MBO1210136.1 hypothetical protein [Staphylococcus simiae]MBO1228730.1 hypothetical protein [Staphylococcus simiae]